MRRQRNKVQMKNHFKTPEKELNKMEINNLSDTEFKTLVIRMLNKLSEDLKSIKKTHSETKDTVIEMKNNLQGNNSRVDEAEDHINDLEHMEAKTTNQNKKKKKELKKNEDSASSLWNNFKKSNIRIMGAREGEEKEQEIGNLFEKIMKENFPNLVRETDMQVQEVQRLPNKMDTKRTTPDTS